MAKSKVALVAAATLISADPLIQKPRLTKLIVKNFRCIGPTPVSIDLDEIVVLVGANNVGKSSILKAYELAMSQGSNKSKLKIDDFPNNRIDPDNLPEIELHTIVYDNSPGERWITLLPNEERVVKERWIWANEGEPKRDIYGNYDKAFELLKTKAIVPDEAEIEENSRARSAKMRPGIKV